MTAFTASQGFIYATGADSPPATAGTVATLVSQMDTKANGYDADSARATANNFVKVSKSNFAASTTSAALTFDTTEANRGTSTDLTVDARHLILGTGFWIIGGEVLWLSAAGNGAVPVQITIGPASGGNGSTGSIIGQLYAQETRDVGGLFGSFTGLTNFDGKYQGVSVSAMLQVTVANQWVAATWGTLIASTNVLYSSLWAFQVGDL